MFDDAPSYGETRAADPALSPPPPARYGASGGPAADRGSTMAAQATRAARTGPTSGAPGAAAGGGRFCGVCGARISGSETFCGQCGSPVTPSGPGGRPSSQPGPIGRYGAGGWDDDPNGYTEALPETPTMAAARNPYAADPYARSYAPQYGSRGAAEAPASGMSRSTRITLGIVFLAVSILLALGAIALLVF